MDSSLSTLETLVSGFCAGMESLYPSILTELRKLLADRNAVRSFDKDSNHSCLYAMRFTGAHRPHLNGFRSTDNVACPSMPLDRRNRPCFQDLLHHGAQRDSLMPLNEWLTRTSVYLGMDLDKVELGRAIRKLAGKEGSHIINEELKGMSFAMSPSHEAEDVQNADYELAWKFLVVDLAVRLLCAVRANGRTLVRRHTLPARELPKGNKLFLIEYNPQGWPSQKKAQ